MTWIALALIGFLALAALCALLLARAGAAHAPDVSLMRQALERRIREGAEFRL